MARQETIQDSAGGHGKALFEDPPEEKPRNLTAAEAQHQQDGGEPEAGEGPHEQDRRPSDSAGARTKTLDLEQALEGCELDKIALDPE